MKNSHACILTALVGLSFGLTSCDTMNDSFSDGYNPLDPPGGATTGVQDPYALAFTPGSFLQTVSPSTVFFAKFPAMEDQPTKILPDYTDVKVISTKGAYVKVEVVNTGEVGYVPSVMLCEKRSPNEVAVTPGLGEVPVTPGIVPGGEAPTALPYVAPEPEVPGIEPPEIVDPSKPAE